MVLGDNDLASLAIVRSLGRANLEVHLAAFERAPITRHSRYVRQLYDFGHPLRQASVFIEKLLQLLALVRFDLVIPTSDKTLVPLMPKSSEINALSRFVAPDEKGFYITNRKDETFSLARRIGVPIPHTISLFHNEELRHCSLPRRFPVVLKPMSSVVANSQQRNEVRIVRSVEELHQRLPEMLERSPLLIQEFCYGSGVGLNVLADRGLVFAAFQHQRVHEPSHGGVSSYRKSCPLDPNLLVAAKKICREIQWTGPAMFEFKVDQQTGKAVLMEINGRFWGSLALPIQAGMDFPLYVYNQFVLGDIKQRFTYKVPFYVRHTVRDLKWFAGNLRTPSGRRDLNKVSIHDLVKEVGNIIRLREGYDLESFSDPLPALVAWSWLGKTLLLKTADAMARAWYQLKAGRLARRVRKHEVELCSRIQQARSILFVCYGNINRSAVAAKCFTMLLQEHRRTCKVGSAGFYERSGRRTSQISFEAAQSLGIDLTDHRSAVVTPCMLDEYDLVVVMDMSHFVSLRKVHPKYGGLVIPLAVFDDDDSRLDISDPHGKDKDTFVRTYSQIKNCVDRLWDIWGSTSLSL